MATSKKATIGGVVEDLAAEFSRFEDELERLRELRDVATSAPRPLEEALQDVPRVVEALARKVQGSFGWLATDPVRGWGQLVESLATTYPPPAAALLARACPDLTARWLEREVTAAYERLPTPMAPAERDQRLAQLDREIVEIERRWSATWWGAIDAGIQIDPPRGISGEALLGLDA